MNACWLRSAAFRVWSSKANGSRSRTGQTNVLNIHRTAFEGAFPRWFWGIRSPRINVLNIYRGVCGGNRSRGIPGENVSLASELCAVLWRAAPANPKNSTTALR